MNITVTITDHEDTVSLPLTCRRGEYNGDGDFTHLLVGEASLESILQAWRDIRPVTRNYMVVGRDDARAAIIAQLRAELPAGIRLYEVTADDTTWLFPLDHLAEAVAGLTWEETTTVPHPPKSAPIDPRHIEDPVRDDPGFWVDEHSDRL